MGLRYLQTSASFELVNYIKCNLLYVGFDYLNGTIEVKPISYCSFNFVFLLIIIWHTCGEDGYRVNIKLVFFFFLQNNTLEAVLNFPYKRICNAGIFLPNNMNMNVRCKTEIEN